jgi:ferredoxin
MKVDNEKCLRCGMCAVTYPEVFSFNDDGDIEVNNDNINEDNKDEINDFAENSCPASAIEKEKVDTE